MFLSGIQLAAVQCDPDYLLARYPLAFCSISHPVTLWAWGWGRRWEQGKQRNCGTGNKWLNVTEHAALRLLCCCIFFLWTSPLFILQERDLGVCEHPLSDIVIAGEAAHPLPHTFHRLLQTISDLMMSLPSGSSLQQMALRYRFWMIEQLFLSPYQHFLMGWFQFILIRVRDCVLNFSFDMFS